MLNFSQKLTCLKNVAYRPFLIGDTECNHQICSCRKLRKALFNLPLKSFLHGTSKTRISGTWSVTSLQIVNFFRDLFFVKLMIFFVFRLLFRLVTKVIFSRKKIQQNWIKNCSKLFTMCDFHNFGLIFTGQCTVCVKG